MPAGRGTGILRDVPTYDYRCERTGEMFELWQSFSEDTLSICPQTHVGESEVCGAEVKKVFSKVGIAFKGDGFYITDYRSDDYKKKESAEKPSTDGGESSSGSSSDPSGSGPSSSDTGGSSSPPPDS